MVLMTVIEVCEADDLKEGMTLAELTLFVQNALRRDIPPEAHVTCRMGWRQQVQRLEVRG